MQVDDPREMRALANRWKSIADEAHETGATLKREWARNFPLAYAGLDLVAASFDLRGAVARLERHADELEARNAS